MRVTLSLLAFVFLGVATAGVVPQITPYNTMVTGSPTGHGVGSPSGVSDHLAPSTLPTTVSRTDNSTDILRPSVSPSDVSDHLEPTGSLVRHRRANPTDVESYIPVPHSTNSSVPHSHRLPTQTDVPSLPTSAPSGDSDHPEPSVLPSLLPASHAARQYNPSVVHSTDPISRGASPTDINSRPYQSGSGYPNPTGNAA